jgi:phage shock protein C
MYCNVCGQAMADQARFCSHCGRAAGHPHRTGTLMRSRRDRKIGGVCAGLAEYLELDPTLVRILAAFLTLASGFFPGLIAYVLGWVIMPEEPALPPVVAPTQQTVAS